MDTIRLVNPDLEVTAIIEDTESLLWTERYSEFGEFEIYTPISPSTLSLLQQGYYLMRGNSRNLMIIERAQIKTDVEFGNRFLITGRSLESLLKRRIVWHETTLSGNIQTVIESLLDDNFIDPLDTNRAVSDFVMKPSTDPIILATDVDYQSTDNKSVYYYVSKICTAAGIGFRVTINEDNEFEFELYNGSDRSYSQSDLPFVTFSPDFENIVSGGYAADTTIKRTVALVYGPGNADERKTQVVEAPDGAGTGWDRREVAIDARDLAEEVDGVPVSTSDYLAMLAQRGSDELAELTDEESFESQVDVNSMFKIDEDFYLGDIVQTEDEYGHNGRARVIEVVRSFSNNGMTVYPTFEIL
jgi:hypothetical protein